MPTVTHTLALLVLYSGRKLPEPSRLLFAKLMVNCCAPGIMEVTCTAKSDWYLPGYMRSAISLRIWVSFAAWFWLTA
ncbi:MAG: hypothetical protein BWX47_01932 [candidate division Hyd24-12 bacterium ADurb.Bin004]|nr:MAG: hypothetical protein BWX47_01932 [candidate division Hyd24-12 bacterium ADurb.Bin004]